MIQLNNFIDGEFVPAAENASEPVLNPATAGMLGRAPLSSGEDVVRAVTAARRALDGWKRVPVGERAAALLRLADAIEEDAEELADLESANAGKPRQVFLDDEIPFLADNLRFFAASARCLQGPTSGEYAAGYTSLLRHEPVGVIGQIAPWNYPLMMAVWKIGPALASGNTVVLKPAETTPLSTGRLAELAADLFPRGVLNVVMGHGEPVGASLVLNAGVDMVSLTGSTSTGKWVAQASAQTLKRVHLELGGKAAVIVFDDVDLEAVLPEIAARGYYNAGQDCTAASRILASAGIYDELVSGLATQANELVLGDPALPKTTLGPLNSAAQRERVEGFLERRGPSCEIITGGDRPDREGFFLTPTVLAGLKQTDEIVQEEVFGPVVSVQRFSSEEQAIEWGNATRYGLAASVWTSDVARAHRVANALDAGTVWINDHMVLASETPHGGFKHSGYGKDLSMYSLADYTRVKHVMVSLASQPAPAREALA